MKKKLVSLLLAALSISSAFADQCYKVESISSKDNIGATVKLKGVDQPILILSGSGTSPDAYGLAKVAFSADADLCVTFVKVSGTDTFGSMEVRR